MQPLINLPDEIVAGWQAELHPASSASPTEAGVFRLVAIRTTRPKSAEEQRIIVYVVDENGLPLAGVPVAFAYTTAQPYTTAGFKWQPPFPRRADIVVTRGSGEIEHIQNRPVNAGEPGGITVCILDPEYSSDVVTGCGMLSDHTGLYMTFQLERTGVVSFTAQLADLARRVEDLEARVAALEV